MSKCGILERLRLSNVACQAIWVKDLPTLLAEAFIDDPLNRFVIPDEARLYRKSLWFYEKIVALVRRRGLIHEIPGKGAALWLKPGSSTLTWRDAVSLGAFLWPLYLGWKATYRLVKANVGWGKMPAETHDPDFWYLFILAVDESARGQGVVRQLLQPVLDESDKTGVPIRLETNRAENVPIYEHFGFQVAHYSNRVSGLEQWNLVRSPAPAG